MKVHLDFVVNPYFYITVYNPKNKDKTKFFLSLHY